MINLDELDLRTLQVEAARALSTLEATNNNIHKFNKEAHHNSQNWYKAVIQWYIQQHGDVPSKVGPGKDIRLLMDV
jgi:hypothetical protein